MPEIGTLTYSMFACGFLVVMTSVVSFGAVTEAKFDTSDPLAVAATGLLMIRLKVQAASFAVRGWPSLHFRPDLIVNVQVSLSVEVVHLVARYGTGLPSSLIVVRDG